MKEFYPGSAVGELLEALYDTVYEDCAYIKDSSIYFDSRGSRPYQKAFRLLSRYGWIKIEYEHGSRIIAVKIDG